MSDSELGMRFRYGGEHELEEVINLYGEKLLRYVTAILFDYQEAEDTFNFDEATVSVETTEGIVMLNANGLR